MALLRASHRALAKQFFKFGLIGGLGFLVDTTFLYYGINKLGLSRVMAGLFSFPFAVTFTWIGNRGFTFPHARREPIGKQWMKFLLVCAVGLVFNRGTYSLLVTNFSLIYNHPFLG